MNLNGEENMPNKVFAERLNAELDNIGLPQHEAERIEAFAKLIKTPRFKAESILHGQLVPNSEILETIAHELEVSLDWLLGKGKNDDAH
jgi:hypothetical protein